MAYDPQDEPLKPECKPKRPPWYSWHTGRKYNGRLEWWADIGYKDPVWRSKKFRGQNVPFKEMDIYWYDPPVPDGTSISGPEGRDGRYFPNTTMKGDQPGNFYEFQEKIMKNSAQYKQIAEKWDLSKEHPGLDVNPLLSGIHHLSASQVGKGNVFPNQFYHYGPRFFDKPINEDCLSKGLCLAKYAAVGTLAYSLMDLKSNPPKNVPYSWGPQVIVRRYVSFLPMPCFLSFVYGVGICTSAAIRKKDDTWNFLAASALFSATFASLKDNVTGGIMLCMGTFFLGVLTQYARTSQKGFQNRVTQQMSSGLYSGPLTWKFYNFGDAPVPTKTY